MTSSDAMTEAPLPPPSLDHLRRMGLRQVAVTCMRIDCQHQAHVAFDALGLAGDTPFPEVSTRRRFTCAGCGGHAADVSLDWRDYRPKGAGWV